MGRIALALAAAAAVASACGGGGAQRPVAPQRTAPAASAGDAGAEAGRGPSVASYDEIVARGGSAAPLMRAGQRLAWSALGDGGSSPLMRDEAGAPASLRFDRDTCVTIVFAATRPVRVWLEDALHVRRGEPATGSSGATPARGPACAKRGEELRVVLDAPDDALVRAVIFTSP